MGALVPPLVTPITLTVCRRSKENPYKDILLKLLFTEFYFQQKQIDCDTNHLNTLDHQGCAHYFLYCLQISPIILPCFAGTIVWVTLFSAILLSL